MRKLLVSLVAVFLAAGSAWAADQAGKLTIRWHGHSFFELVTSKGTKIVFDPHAIENYGRQEASADLILISHEHNDHTQKEVVKDFEKAKIIPGLKTNGNKLDWNRIDENFRDVHIQSVGTYHDHVSGAQYGKNTIFIVEVDGLRIVHLGDLGHLLNERALKAIGQVDVLMIPVGGVYTLNGDQARKVVAQLKPRMYILPMHYGIPKVYDDLLPVDEFLEEQKNVEKKTTNALVVDPEAKPAAPTIVLLDWKSPQ
jgi:L-ascorbate metabolism protein UlaG (beta-lactamase superfamily)